MLVTSSRQRSKDLKNIQATNSSEIKALSWCHRLGEDEWKAVDSVKQLPPVLFCEDIH